VSEALEVDDEAVAAKWGRPRHSSGLNRPPVSRAWCLGSNLRDLPRVKLKR
jgi:hypothetical protein